MKELIFDKNEFKNVLENKIVSGKSLLEIKITSEEDYYALERKFNHYNEMNREYLKQAFDGVDGVYYRGYCDSSRDALNGSYAIKTLRDRALLFKRNIRSKVDNLEILLDKLELYPTSSNSIQSTQKMLVPTTKEINKNVFIVHGHDNELKEKVARFLSIIGLEPIILHEQVSSSRTIIEKLERETDNVGYGIILYTLCDVGYKKGDEGNLKSRARQNVVFEHGLLMGLIGRAKTCVIAEDGVELPNDISGIVYNPSGEDWKSKLVQELNGAGYSIDTDKWLK